MRLGGPSFFADQFSRVQVPTASGVESVFSVPRVERTLTRDYFKLLGVLSRTEKGLRYDISLFHARRTAAHSCALILLGC